LAIPPLRIEDESVEQVDSFNYLGSLITADGRCENESQMRTGMAKENGYHFPKQEATFANEIQDSE